jgi:hypothetical protein
VAVGGLRHARRDTLDRAPCRPPLPLLCAAGRRVLHGLPPWRQAEWAAGRFLAEHLVAEVTGGVRDAGGPLPRAEGGPARASPARVHRAVREDPQMRGTGTGPQRSTARAVSSRIRGSHCR